MEILAIIWVILISVALVMIIFTLGRVYETSIIIREIDDKIDDAKCEIEFIDKQIAMLRGDDR